MCLVYICQRLSSHPKILLCTELIELWSNSPHINCDVIDISEGFKQLTFVLHCGLVNFELYIIHLHLPQHWILRFSWDSNWKPRSIHLSCWAKGGEESIIFKLKYHFIYEIQTLGFKHRNQRLYHSPIIEESDLHIGRNHFSLLIQSNFFLRILHLLNVYIGPLFCSNNWNLFSTTKNWIKIS